MQLQLLAATYARRVQHANTSQRECSAGFQPIHSHAQSVDCKELVEEFRTLLKIHIELNRFFMRECYVKCVCYDTRGSIKYKMVFVKIKTYFLYAASERRAIWFWLNASGVGGKWVVVRRS